MSTITLPPGHAAALVGHAIVAGPESHLADASARVAAHHTLFRWAEREATATLRSNRGAAHVATLAGTPAVVRHARRGGALARLLEDRYVRSGQPRPIEELSLSAALRALDIDTPRVLAAAVYPAGALFYRGDVATEHIPDSADLADRLFTPGDVDPVEAARAAGRLVRRLHDRRVVHPDLNLRNILIQRAGAALRPWIIDLDRCRIVATLDAPARRGMLARLDRSWTKLEAEHQTPQPAALSAFHEAYEAGIEVEGR